MSYVTLLDIPSSNCAERMEYLSQIEKHISLDAPVTLSSSDIYIVFGEKAFHNPILMEAAKGKISAYSVLGYPSSVEEEELEQLWAAKWWKKTFNKSHIKSLEPTDWLNPCLKDGGINHILWALKHGKDVVSQYHWAHDINGLESTAETFEEPEDDGYSVTSGGDGIGLGRNHHNYAYLNRRQRFWPGFSRNFRGYPLSRRGKQPRGKSMADKRKGNLNSRYRKDL